MLDDFLSKEERDWIDCRAPTALTNVLLERLAQSRAENRNLRETLGTFAEVLACSPIRDEDSVELGYRPTFAGALLRKAEKLDKANLDLEEAEARIRHIANLTGLRSNW